MKLRIRHTGSLSKCHFNIDDECLAEVRRVVEARDDIKSENILWFDFYTGEKTDKQYKSGKYYVGGRPMTRQDIIDEFVEKEDQSINPLLFLDQMTESGLFIKLDYDDPGKIAQLGGIYDYKPFSFTDKIISHDLKNILFEATGKSDIDPESDYTP
jgi:hypothetical protein